MKEYLFCQLQTSPVTTSTIQNWKKKSYVNTQAIKAQWESALQVYLRISLNKQLIRKLYRNLIVCRGSCLIPDLSRWIIHRRGSGCSQRRKVNIKDKGKYTNPCRSGDAEDTVSSWVKKPTQESSSWQQSTTRPTSSWVKKPTTTKSVSIWESPTPKSLSQWEQQQQPTEKPTSWTKSTVSPTLKWATDWVQPYSPVPKVWQKRELDSGK